MRRGVRDDAALVAVPLLEPDLLLEVGDLVPVLDVDREGVDDRRALLIARLACAVRVAAARAGLEGTLCGLPAAQLGARQHLPPAEERGEVADPEVDRRRRGGA